MYKHAYVKELLLLNFKNKRTTWVLIGSDYFDIKNGDFKKKGYRFKMVDQLY